MRNLVKLRSVGSCKNAFIIVVVVVAASSFSGFVSGQAVLNFSSTVSPAVISLGNDIPTRTAVMEIKKAFPNTNILSFEDYNELKRNFPRHAKYLFYIGHGDLSGLYVGQSVVSWNDINSLAVTYEGIHQFFLACYSDAVNSPDRTTFSSSVDAITAAKLSILQIKLFESKIISTDVALAVLEMTNEILSHEQDIIDGKKEALYLATESGYTLAFQKVNIRSGWWIFLRDENVLYLNMGPSIIDSVLFIGGAIIIPMAGKIADKIVAVIGVIGIMTAAVWAALLIAFIVLAAVSFYWNMDHRGGNDVKFGYGANIYPVPLPYLRFDNTYNQAGGDFIIPLVNFLGPLMIYCVASAVALSFLPNNIWYGVTI